MPKDSLPTGFCPAYSAGQLTGILGRIAAGEEQAKNELFECVYDELYAMARRQMMNESPDHTLGATGLVHEVYLRLRGPALERERAYFFGAAAQAMYRILVEHARQSRTRQNRVSVDAVLDDLEVTHRMKMLDLSEALERLKAYGERGRRQHDVIVQRFFGGLSWKEIAANVEVSVATVEKDWQAARAWLYKELKRGLDR